MFRLIIMVRIDLPMKVSVTRISKISPLCQYVTSLWQVFSITQKCVPTLAEIFKFSLL